MYSSWIDTIFLLAGVYLKMCKSDLREDIASLSLSPCYFKMPGQDKSIEKNGLEVLDSHRGRKPRNMLSETISGTYVGTVDFSIHDKIVTALSHDLHCKEDLDTTSQSDNRQGLRRLLQAWFLAQLDAIVSTSGVEANSLVLGKETVLHFEVKGCDFDKFKVQASNESVENRKNIGEVPLEFLFLLTISGESLHAGKVNSYKLTFDKSKRDILAGMELFGKLKLGDPVSLYTLKERSLVKGFSTNISSLSWMGTTATDVINSRYFSLKFLAIACRFWGNTHEMKLQQSISIKCTNIYSLVFLSTY